MVQNQEVTIHVGINGNTNSQSFNFNRDSKKGEIIVENLETDPDTGPQDLPEGSRINLAISVDFNELLRQLFDNTEEMGLEEFVVSFIEKARYSAKMVDYNYLIISLSRLKYFSNSFEGVKKSFKVTWKRKFSRHDFQVYIFKSGFIGYNKKVNTSWYSHIAKPFDLSFGSNWYWAYTNGNDFSFPRSNCQTIFGPKKYIVWADANPVHGNANNDYNYVCYWGERKVKKYLIKKKSSIITGITIVYEKYIETVGEKPSKKDDFIILPPDQVISGFLIDESNNSEGFENNTITTLANKILKRQPSSIDTNLTQRHKGIFGSYNKKENYIESIGIFY